MAAYPKPFTKLIKALARLPGIGERTATRLALHLFHLPKNDVDTLAKSLIEVKDSLKLCSRCFNLTDIDPCPICQDNTRDSKVICVVEDIGDLMAIERTHVFKGRYHVLHGAISPLKDVTPDRLKIEQLVARIKNEWVREVILATNPDAEGEATATYLMQLIKPLKVKVTRIARGIPMGGDLEYTDEITLAKAMEGRRET